MKAQRLARLITATGLALGAGGGLAVPASAGTARVVDGVLTYRAAPGERRVIIDRYGAGYALNVIARRTTPGAGCARYLTGSVRCVRPRRIVIRMGATNDQVVVDDRIGVPAYIYGGPGHDTLTGGSGNDVIVGGPGFDALRGGVGNDRLDARDGREDQWIDGGLGRNALLIDALDRAVARRGAR